MKMTPSLLLRISPSAKKYCVTPTLAKRVTHIRQAYFDGAASIFKFTRSGRVQTEYEDCQKASLRGKYFIWCVALASSTCLISGLYARLRDKASIGAALPLKICYDSMNVVQLLPSSLAPSLLELWQLVQKTMLGTDNGSYAAALQRYSPFTRHPGKGGYISAFTTFQSWKAAQCKSRKGYSSFVDEKVQARKSKPLVFEHKFEIGNVLAKQIAANSPIEDRFCIEDISEYNCLLCSVIDGHSGWTSADYIMQVLPSTIANVLKDASTGTDFQDSMRKGFLNLDESLKNYLLETSTGNYPQSGACCVAVLISNDKYYVANVGDCMAVLSRNGAAVPLNSQHNANIPSEREKIKAAHPNEDDAVVCKRSWVQTRPTDSLWGRSLNSVGLLGQVTHYSGCYVKNSLNPTRSFGDFHLKEELYAYDTVSKKKRVREPFSFPYITASPEIKVIDRDPKDEFLIIGSDGLWDFFSPEEAIETVSKSRGASLEAAADALIQKVYQRASDASGMPLEDLLAKSSHTRRRYYDDLTVCIIALQNEENKQPSV